MNKPISLGLLVGGAIALTYGLIAADSLSSTFSRFFTGSPSDTTMLLVLGGAIAAAIGITGLLRGPKVQ